jgi:hypothetical protein
LTRRRLGGLVGKHLCSDRCVRLAADLLKTRVLALVRFAGAARAQAVARMPDERCAATLLAFIRALEASAQDDVLDLFDLLVTRMFVDAVRKGRAARLRGLRDLDAAALTLSKVCALVLDGAVTDADLRAAVFVTVPQAALETAMAQVDSLTARRTIPTSTSCWRSTAASDVSCRTSFAWSVWVPCQLVNRC